MPDDTARLYDLLHVCSTLALATVDPAGLPHAANLNFVADDELAIYWLSSPESAHSRHIAQQPVVAATAHPPFDRPADIRGIQLHGRAEITPPDRFDALWHAFCEKFPYAAEMEQRARTQRFYQLRPTWARLIDNAIHFGFKQEWQLA